MSVRLCRPLTFLPRTVGPALATAVLIWAPGVASGAPKKPATSPPRCDRCQDLPMLEEQFFQQEFLRQAFNEYLVWKLPPIPKNKDTSATQAMVDQVTADFNAYLNSPAGGGGGVGGAELGTDNDSCKLVYYVKGPDGKNVIDPKTKKEKTIPFDEKEYRTRNCAAISDYLLAHENQHVADCKNDHKDLSQWRNYAAADVRAYANGMRNLRKSIAKLASNCGWQGSTRKTKKDAQGEDAVVIPTMDEARKLATTLKKGGKK
jgi:hypothetical protein